MEVSQLQYAGSAEQEAALVSQVRPSQSPALAESVRRSAQTPTKPTTSRTVKPTLGAIVKVYREPASVRGSGFASLRGVDRVSRLLPPNPREDVLSVFLHSTRPGRGHARLFAACP